jgi:hypothetical protein
MRTAANQTASGTTAAKDDEAGLSPSTAHHADVARTVGAAAPPGLDRHVVVLATSTSTTGIGRGFELFEPDTMYELTLNQAFFDELARPDGKGLLDLARPVGKHAGDYFTAGGAVLSGTKAQSTTFSVHSMLQGTGRLGTNALTVRAAGNGMLNVARLASAYISAKQNGALGDKPAKLELACEITFGMKAGTDDKGSRKEMVLSTSPPSFTATANGMANGLMAGLLGAFGFQAEVDPSATMATAMTKTAGDGGKDSARMFAELAERSASASWKDRASRRSFVTTPITGIADALMTAVGASAATQADDYDPDALRTATFGSKHAASGRRGEKNRSIDATVKAKVIGLAKGLLPAIREQIVAAQAVGLAAEVPKAFASYLDPMIAKWAAAVDAGLAAISWDFWYQHNFKVNQWGTATAGPPTLVTGHEGNVEGATHNPIRVHAAEADDAPATDGN